MTVIFPVHEGGRLAAAGAGGGSYDATNVAITGGSISGIASLAVTGSTTFGSLPAASGVSGAVYFVSNIGTNGTYFRSNGTIWRPLSGMCVLAQSAVASSVTGTTTETTLATLSIPAGLMTVNGGLRITSLWSYTNSANTKTLRVKFDGNAFTAAAATTSATFQTVTLIRNRNAANSQVGFPSSAAGTMNVSTSAATTAAADTTTARNLDITGQLANTGETITLEAYTVELIIP